MTISLALRRAQGLPSIVGYFFNYKDDAVGDFFFQDESIDTIDPELLKEHVKNLFVAFQKKYKSLPEHVVIFRSNVHENRQDLIKDVEFFAIKEELSTLYENSEIGCQFTLIVSRMIRLYDFILKSYQVKELVPGIFIGNQKPNSLIFFWFSLDGVGLTKIVVVVNETNMNLKCAEHFIYGLCAIHQYDTRFEKNEPSKMVHRILHRGVQIINALKQFEENCQILGNCKELTEEFSFKRYLYL